MPKKLDDCVWKLMAKGHSKSSAFAICTASLNKKKKKVRGATTK